MPCATFVAGQQAVAISLRSYLHVQGAQPFVSYGLVALSILMLVLAGMLVAALMLDHPSPIQRVRSYLSENSDRITVLVIGFALAWIQLVTLTSTKTLIPALGPMWADSLLAGLDHALLGVDAWRVTEFLNPVGPAIDALYALWPLVIQGALIAMLLASPSQARSRAVMAFFLTAGIIGVAGQFPLPSGGPIFWHRMGLGDRFDAMPSAGHTIAAANYLWSKHLGDTTDFATGISAFPSMHVAMAAWMAITVQALFPRLRFIAWAYFAVIVMGSVFLGWHYLADPFIPATHPPHGPPDWFKRRSKMTNEMSYPRRVVAALCMLGLWSPNWLPRCTSKTATSSRR